MTSRIYNPVDYGGNYQGSAKDGQYVAINPLDQSDAIKKRAQQKIDNVTNLAKAAEIQGKLDNATLSGNQKIASARLTRDQKMLQGVISLTKSGVDLWGKVSVAQEQAKQNQEIFNSMVGPNALDNIDQVKADNAVDNNTVNAESKATNEVSTELEADGSIESKSTSHQLQESTTHNLTKNIKGSVQSARAIHQLYLNERLRNIPDNEKPRTVAEANALLQKLNKEFLQETGLLDKRLIGEVVEHLSPTMIANTANTANTLITAGIKADQDANLEFAKSAIATLVDNKTGAQDLWEKAYIEVLNGDVGFTGPSDALNQKVLELVLDELSHTGPEGAAKIAELRKVLKIPGQKGTELEKQYGHLFDKYERQANQNAASAYSNAKQLKASKLQVQVDNYYENPSEEGKLKAIQALKKMNSPESIALAQKLAQTGLGYDPHKATELFIKQAQGEELDENMLRNLLDENVISADEYTKLKESGPLRQSKKELDTTLEKLDKTITAALLQSVPEERQNATLKRQAGVRVIAIKADLRSAVLAELRADKSLIGNKKELAAVIDRHLEKLLNQPQYKAIQSPDKGKQWHFPDAITNDTNLAAISVPGKAGVEDYSGLSHDQLFNQNKVSIGEMNPTKDYFFKKEQLGVEIKRFKTDGYGSKRLQELSASMGYSPKAFLNAQMRLFGLPNINKIQLPDIEAPTSFNGLNSGFKYLVSEGGLPWRGSAYLAANIEALTGWNFNLDDTAGLQASPWMQVPTRVAAIEKHFGKKIDQISNREQLSYMLVDLKENYPEAYRVFMDPKASYLALTKATYDYFGFQFGDVQSVAEINGKIKGLLTRAPE